MKAKALQRAKHRVHRSTVRTVVTARAVVRNGVCYATTGKRRAQFAVADGVSDGQKLIVAHDERGARVSLAVKITVAHWKTQNSTGARRRRLRAIKERIFHAVGAWEQTPQYGVFRVIARTDAQRQALLKIQDENADILTIGEF
jgi:hypothetical protein